MSLMINGSLILMKANLTLQKLLYLLNNQIYSIRFLSNSLATSIKLAVICIGKPTIIQGPLICLIIYITSILSHLYYTLGDHGPKVARFFMRLA